MQDKIFKVKIFEVTHKSVKSVKVFSLEIFRLYGSYMGFVIPLKFEIRKINKICNCFRPTSIFNRLLFIYIELIL